MTRFLALLVLSAIAACHAPPPSLELPRPYQRDGVRVVVKELYMADDKALGITGDAENVSSSAFTTCTIHFDVMDFHELSISDASATRASFEPGEHWKFIALFSSPFTAEFDAVRVKNVVVTKSRPRADQSRRTLTSRYATASPWSCRQMRPVRAWP